MPSASPSAPPEACSNSGGADQSLRRFGCALPSTTDSWCQVARSPEKPHYRESTELGDRALDVRGHPCCRSKQRHRTAAFDEHSPSQSAGVRHREIRSEVTRRPHRKSCCVVNDALESVSLVAQSPPGRHAPEHVRAAQPFEAILRQCSGRDHGVGAVRSSLPSTSHAGAAVQRAVGLTAEPTCQLSTATANLPIPYWRQ